MGQEQSSYVVPPPVQYISAPGAPPPPSVVPTAAPSYYAPPPAGTFTRCTMPFLSRSRSLAPGRLLRGAGSTYVLYTASCAGCRDRRVERPVRPPSPSPPSASDLVHRLDHGSRRAAFDHGRWSRDRHGGSWRSRWRCRHHNGARSRPGRGHDRTGSDRRPCVRWHSAPARARAIPERQACRSRDRLALALLYCATDWRLGEPCSIRWYVLVSSIHPISQSIHRSSSLARSLISRSRLTHSFDDRG